MVSTGWEVIHGICGGYYGYVFIPMNFYDFVKRSTDSGSSVIEPSGCYM